jgi:hypothetical protein
MKEMEVQDQGASSNSYREWGTVLRLELIASYILNNLSPSSIELEYCHLTVSGSVGAIETIKVNPLFAT